MDIDKIDRRLIELISRRSNLYIEELLRRGNGEDTFSLEEKQRIKALIEKYNTGPLSGETLRKVFYDLLYAAHSSVVPVSVAYLGPEGTFTNMALMEFFGESVEPLPQRTIADVFRTVESGGAMFGIVPVENSTEGAVTFTLDELIETDLSVTAEEYMRITYSLLSRSTDLEDIRRVYSHPQPVGQCKTWLRSNLPGAEVEHVDSTSRAAECAMQNDHSAAIASAAAGEIYGLSVLAEEIEDLRQNYTRFFVIGRKENRPTGKDKTSLACAIKDRPGALLGLLKPFSDAGINLTKIESRPDKKKVWEYVFFIDFIGHREDSIVQSVLDAIRQDTIFLKVLGSYPTGN